MLNLEVVKDLTGTLDSFAHGQHDLTELSISYAPNIRGDLGSVCHCLHLRTLVLCFLESVEGHLDDMAELRAMRDLNISYTAIEGPLSALRGMGELRSLVISGLSELTGDLASDLSEQTHPELTNVTIWGCRLLSGVHEFKDARGGSCVMDGAAYGGGPGAGAGAKEHVAEPEGAQSSTQV